MSETCVSDISAAAGVLYSLYLIAYSVYAMRQREEHIEQKMVCLFAETWEQVDTELFMLFSTELVFFILLVNWNINGKSDGQVSCQ